MVVKFMLTNSKRKQSFPYGRNYEVPRVSGVYSDLIEDKWILTRGRNKMCFSKQDIIIMSIEREEDE